MFKYFEAALLFQEFGSFFIQTIFIIINKSSEHIQFISHPHSNNHL